MYKTDLKNYLKKSSGKPRKKLIISYEILPPGTLKRNSSCYSKDSTERWEEILDVCAGVMVEDREG